MKSAGTRVQIVAPEAHLRCDGSRFGALRSELDVTLAVSPSCCHHRMSCRRHALGVTRLTVSMLAGEAERERGRRTCKTPRFADLPPGANDKILDQQAKPGEIALERHAISRMSVYHNQAYTRSASTSAVHDNRHRNGSSLRTRAGQVRPCRQSLLHGGQLMRSLPRSSPGNIREGSIGAR